MQGHRAKSNHTALCLKNGEESMKRVKPTLLVIDDDCEVLETSSALLRHFGFTVISTSSPVEALHLLQNNAEIDGVVSDFRMPIMDGEELAQAARMLRPELPVIILSGTFPPKRHPVPWDAWILKGSSITDLVARLDAVTFKCGSPCSEPRQQRRNAS